VLPQVHSLKSAEGFGAPGVCCRGAEDGCAETTWKNRDMASKHADFSQQIFFSRFIMYINSKCIILFQN